MTWHSSDLPTVSRIVGPEEARKGKTKANPAILYAAERQGLILSPVLARRLKKAKALRRETRPIKKQKDVAVEKIAALGYSRNVVERMFAHQRVALAFMEYVDAYLIRDQPGVGKTPVAVAWAQKRASSRVLVITPNSAKFQWEDEIARWSHGADFTKLPERVSIIDGTIAEQNRIASERDGWVVGHWESLVHARKGILANDWDVVILDEGHEIRNREIQRSATAHAIGKKTAQKLVLTAHPFVKAPDDLFSILRFLYPDDYTSYWRFFAMHVLATPKPFGGFTVHGTRSPKLLRWELDPFTIGRKKSEVFKTTPVTRIARHVQLPAKYQKDYDNLRKQFFVELEGRDKRLPVMNVLSRTTRLRQYVIDPQLLGSKLPSLKYPIVAELLSELDAPLVVFTSFREAGERLIEFLRKKKYRCGMVAGRVNGRKQTPRERREVQKKFHRGDYDVVVIVTAAGGSALNFGKYGYIAYLDLPWTAKDLEQTEGRVDRPDAVTGEVSHTTAYRIVVKGSYEDKVEKKIEETHANFVEVFDPKNLVSLF